jgi:hypothetical protein
MIMDIGLNYEVRFVYGAFPAFIIWTDKSLKDWQGAVTRGNVIIARPKYRGVDEGIIEHELTHVKQFYRTGSVHSWLYLFSKTYRLFSEAETYAKQLSVYPDWKSRVDKFVGYLFESYDLDMTESVIKAALLNELHKLDMNV